MVMKGVDFNIERKAKIIYECIYQELYLKCGLAS